MTRVVIVGGGNAALCAAISARERGADVVLLERASYELRGGNSRFTAGAMRTVYEGIDDLLKIMPDLTASEIERTEFGTYVREDFYEDLGRVTNYRIDPDLAERLVEDSFETLRWMRQHGVRFLPLYGRLPLGLLVHSTHKRLRPGRASSRTPRDTEAGGPAV